MARRAPLRRSTKRLGPGKNARLWAETRAEWFKQNPANTYTCYLQLSPLCPRVMTPAETTLDHVKSRGRHPELRYELSNLRPACGPCQQVKGSLDLEDLGLADVA
jgi:5-methylcytosine-specific restriction endonuclease McrA